MFESKGWLRTIGGALTGVGVALLAIPEPHCLVIGTALLKVGGIIGGTGVVRAVLQGKLPQ
jgi:hypothetical protein